MGTVIGITMSRMIDLRLLKKTLAVCLIGFGLGILMVILLPFTGWLFITGIVIIIAGFAWLTC
jgi:hypothetical protein